jgi:Uma2 family endonuclease
MKECEMQTAQEKENVRGYSGSGGEETDDFTYDDYLDWPEGERREIFNGMAVMQPTPVLYHQGISANLTVLLANLLRGKSGKVYAAPVTVRLFPQEDNRDKTVLEPDLIVVLDTAKLMDKKACRGAPDMVVEILSPGTARYDKVTKVHHYETAGVREYWIINPADETLQVYTLAEDGRYRGAGYRREHTVVLTALAGCTINLEEVFGDLA